MSEAKRSQVLRRILITSMNVSAFSWMVSSPGNSATVDITPLQPTSPWVIDGEEGECLLQRGYISARKAAITIALRGDPYGNHVSFLVVEKGDLPLGIDTGHLIFEPSGQDLATYVRGDKLSDGRSAYRINQHEDAPSASDMLNGVQSVKITVGSYSRIFATPGIEQALKSLVGCDKMLISSWNLDPAERDHIKIAPKPLNKPQTWISSSDYPSAALAASLQGNTRVLYAIGTNGHVTDCRVIVSSGDKGLDATACRSIVANARFDPAQDLDGHVVAAHSVDTIYWRIG